MTNYERRKRESHAVIARCAYSDCTIDNHQIRASMDLVRYWGVNRPVHAICFDLATKDRQRSGGTVVQSREV